MGPSTLDNLPAVFGRYVLLRRLSRGGMGEIFLGKVGEIQGFEKPIVIKKILPALSRDEQFIERFIEEAKIAINLSHGNIVPVYEVGKVDDQYFLAMQYVEGRDLRTLLQRAQERGRGIPPELALLVVREMANGLAYAHRRTDNGGRPLDLVHCDISPPNVLVSFEGEVKVIDFGIAKSTHRARREQSIGFGKFGYMAPEQLVRGGVIDRRTDIYACGVVLYELLTGERLFQFPPNVDYRQVAREVTAGRYLRPSERNPELEAFDGLVLRALRAAPDERFGSAEALRDAVQAQLYTMSPTISTDALAEYVRELFPSALEKERQMLRQLAKTDLEVFRHAVEDGTSHTVSFALGGAYRTHHSFLSRLPETPPLPGEAGADGVGTPQDQGVGESTRPLSAAEQAEALEPAAEPRERRSWLVPGLAAGIALLLGLFGTLLLLPKDPPSKEPRATASGGPDGGAARSSRDTSVVRRGAPDSAPERVAPVVINRSPRRRVARRRRASKKPPDRVPRAVTKGPTAAQVQRKFRRIKSEYRRFERAYGARLKGEWQRILFALTYRKGKPAELDGMLEGLRRRMAAVRRGP